MATTLATVFTHLSHSRPWVNVRVNQNSQNTMQIVTGIEVNSEAYFPKLREN